AEHPRALGLGADRGVDLGPVGAGQRARVFCVRADAGTEGSAVTPASGRHGGVLVGVLSGGEPLRSAAVRDSILDGLRAG
ncbi:uroporphyrinogen-III C-methyltransferase, partial [Amycolatopsis magusensis]|nr:uroporphyrinogen-III C-methyltransferase [Amycolatopsis magusensis]